MKSASPQHSRQFAVTVAYLAERTPGCPPDVTVPGFLAQFAASWHFLRFDRDKQGTHCPCGTAIKLRCFLRQATTKEEVYIGEDCFGHLHKDADKLVTIQQSLLNGLTATLLARHERENVLYFEIAAKNTRQAILCKFDPHVVSYFGGSPLYKRLLKVHGDEKGDSNRLVCDQRYKLHLYMSAHPTMGAAMYTFYALQDDADAVADNQRYRLDRQAVRRDAQADKEYEYGNHEASDSFSGESEPTDSGEQDEEEEEEQDNDIFSDDREDDEKLPSSEGDYDPGISTWFEEPLEPRHKRSRKAIASFFEENDFMP